MEFSELTLRIVLLFTPGIIALIIIDKLTIHKELKSRDYFLYALVLGFISYLSCLLLYLVINILAEPNWELTFFKALTVKETPLDLTEILIATGMSILIGFLLTFLISNKILYRVSHYLGISKKYMDGDVRTFLMNLKDIVWVVVRDIENDLMYEGWIDYFSDSTGDIDELFLRDVTVFKNSTGEEFYDVPGLYLARKRTDLTLEFPWLEFKYSERAEEDVDGKKADTKTKTNAKKGTATRRNN